MLGLKAQDETVQKCVVPNLSPSTHAAMMPYKCGFSELIYAVCVKLSAKKTLEKNIKCLINNVCTDYII